MKNNRAFAFFAITAVYVLAAVCGAAVYRALAYGVWLRLLIADAAATAVVFVFSLVFKNASVYDPYWSVQPIVILTAFAADGTGSAGLVLLFAVWVWGVRLTGNWAYCFKGFAHEDWRYAMLREQSGAFYPLVNFFGIHLFPTLVVYLCVLPAVRLIRSGAQATAGSVFFSALCVLCAALQLAADAQMQAFRKHGSGGFIRTGLWKYARHPNYLGEIMMWWCVAGAAACGAGPDPLCFTGAAVNTLMFLFISIPMADRRNALRGDFEEYRRQTRALLPIKK